MNGTRVDILAACMVYVFMVLCRLHCRRHTHTDQYGSIKGYSSTNDYGLDERTTHTDQFGGIIGYSTTKDYGYSKETTHTDQYGNIVGYSKEE